MSVQDPGLAIAVFLGATGLGAKISCPRRDLAEVWKQSLAGAVLAAALFPLVLDYSLLSLLIGICGLCLFTLMATGSFVNSPIGNAGKVARLIFSGPVTFPLALIRAVRSLVKPRRIGPIRFAGWVLPIGLGLVFLNLFSTANPIIEHWLSLVDFLAWIASIDVMRVVFILAAMALSWPFLQGRLAALRRRAKPVTDTKPVSRAKPEGCLRIGPVGPCRHDPLAGAVQCTVCGADGPRHRLSVGRPHTSRRHEFFKLCTSRCLSAGRDRAHCGGLHAGRHAARQRDGKLGTSAPSRPSVDRTECPAGSLLHIQARPLCRRLLPDAVAGGSLCVDGPCRRRTGADHGTHLFPSEQYVADPVEIS